MGLLQFVHVKEWQKGKIPYLEKMIQGSVEKINYAMKYFHLWANKKGLKSSQMAYLARTKGPKRELQFSKNNDSALEKAFRTYYVSPALSEKKYQRIQEKLNTAPELVVFMTINDSECAQCKKKLMKGNFLLVEVDQALCLTCAGFDTLHFLPSGNAKLTRYVKQYSALCIVVVRFSRTRKRYERQGILVEPEAIEKAEHDRNQ